MHRRWLLTIIALLICGTASAQPRYNLYDLGDLGAIGGLTTGFSAGDSVNISGQVAGNAMTPDLYGVGFRTGPAGLGIGPSSLLGLDTDAYGINDRGQVAGAFIYVDPTTHVSVLQAYRTSPSGTAFDPGADLGSLDAIHGSTGYAINASGQVAGVSDNHAFRTSATGLVTDPGADLGPGSAYGINDSGQVTGGHWAANGQAHAFRTSATGTLADPGVDLGTLGGTRSVGTGINASGQVVGYSTNAAGQGHAFRTTANGLVGDAGSDLGTLPGDDQSGAQAINALEYVVGESENSNTRSGHAFLYTTQMWDLNDLIEPGTGWVLKIANGINDLGWITGESAAYRGFLLIPVDGDPGTRTPITGIPEPSSLALGAVAIAGGWVVRRRRSFLVRRSAA
jgi:probable HAF family extracellular repeat protein